MMFTPLEIYFAGAIILFITDLAKSLINKEQLLERQALFNGASYDQVAIARKYYILGVALTSLVSSLLWPVSLLISLATASECKHCGSVETDRRANLSSPLSEFLNETTERKGDSGGAG